MTRYANVSEWTTVILSTGHAGKLKPGCYDVVELDGQEGRLFLLAPGNHELIQANPADPNISIEES